MYNLLKPFGDNREEALVGDMVNFLSLTKPEGVERHQELEEKLKICDILQADVDVTVDDELLSKAPNLKYILCTSIGVDYVDLDAATKRNILVANNPDFCVVAVAEYAVGLMYSIMRRIPEGINAVSTGKWSKRDYIEQTELCGKTLGIIGFGKTGQDVARQALGIGMNVHVRVNIPDLNNKAEKIIDMGALPMSLEDVLTSCDVLSLHVPMTKGTENLIGKRELGMMKPSSYLINVARGGVVDESALVESLTNGKIAGAALDVLVDEPPLDDNPLLDYKGDNLIVTPHVAWYTKEADQKNDAHFIKQVRDIVQDNTLQGVVNKQVQVSK